MKILAALSVDALAKRISKARTAYYRGHPIMTDSEYDKLEEELRARNPDHPVLRYSGADVPTKLKVRLPFPMPSLTKKKQGFNDWAAEHPGPYVVSWKVDGISGLKDDRKTRSRLFTRGRSGDYEGGDISYLLPALALPTGKGTVVRGELIMENRKFASKWAQDFANPRNMAGGLTNRVTVHKGVPDLDFLVYEVIEPRMKPSEGFARAKAMGYKVVPHKLFYNLDEAKLLKLLRVARANGKYEVDGLVIAQDKKTPVSKGDPDHTIAFKADSEDDAKQTTVTELQWRLTRTGFYFPRLVVKPVLLKGATVTYASGKSAEFVRDNKLGPGAVIRLRRSGDVIPDLRAEDVIKPGKVVWPPKSEYEWSGANIRKPKSLGNDEQVKGMRLSHFFTTLGIDRFKPTTAEKYVRAGYDTPRKIMNMSPRAFDAVLNNTLSKVIWEQIQGLRQGVYLSTLMYASQVFGRAFGSRKLDAIVKAHPDILEKAWMSAPTLQRLIDDVPGFDVKQASVFATNLPKFVQFYERLGLPLIQPKKVKLLTQKLKGQSVLFTGFRDQELEAVIQKNGGTVASGTAKATILLAKDVNGSSDKIRAFKAAGKPVMTAQQFRKKYGL